MLIYITESSRKGNVLTS